MIGLTPKQKECLSFISLYIDESGVPPSFTEIADALGLKSRSGTHRLVTGLEHRGAIRRTPGRSRSLEVIPDNERRMVPINPSLWGSLTIYALTERISIETAVNQFIRDGLEGA